jgi:hypothetical protein
MNPRFLPFVSQDTSLSVIHRKLQESGEGVPPDLILGILSKIAADGVEKTRENLSKFDKLDSWNARYNALLAEFAVHEVPTGTTYFIKLLEEYVTEEDFATITDPDVSSLDIAYIRSRGPGDLDYLGSFKFLVELKDVSDAIRDFATVGLFQTPVADGPVYPILRFSSPKEIEAYIFYTMRISAEPLSKVTAVFKAHSEVPF